MEIKINRIEENKEKYIDLLLEADPDINMVNRYINEGEMYVAFEGDKAVCTAIVVKVDSNICELKNIATTVSERGKGYAKKLIRHILNEYKGKYKKMIVGTTENNIPFYVKCGFDKYYKTVKNFFVDNYIEEVWDGGLHCIDMYYYYINLENTEETTSIVSIHEL